MEREGNLVGGLAVWNGIGVADFNRAVGRDRAKEGTDYTLGLVRTPHVAIADVEDNQRVNPRGKTRRRRCELQHCVLARRHSQRSDCLGSVGHANCAQRELGFAESAETLRVEENGIWC